MGHKWLWNASLGGYPPEEFFVAVDPLLAGMREKLDGPYHTSDKIAGSLCSEWASKLGLAAGELPHAGTSPRYGSDTPNVARMATSRPSMISASSVVS